MKNAAPFVITAIVTIAIIMSLHQEGRLFTSTSSGKQTASVSQSKSAGQVKGASTTLGGSSPYENYVGIASIKDPGTFAGLEHITIKNSFRDPVNITGWSITSEATGHKAVIGTASPFPEVLPAQAITLQKGDKVVLLSGTSPVDFSFRINQCTGYFEDKTYFTPDLPLQCPLADDEDVLSEQIENSDKCMDYLESIDRCDVPPKQLPNLPSYCEAYIKTYVSYDGCVELYGSEKDFFKKEWRVFLNSKFPYWHKEKDTLRLWDAQGRLVDVYEYEFEDWDN